MASDHQVRLAERELRAYLLQRVCALLALAAVLYLAAVTLLGPYLPWMYGALAICAVSVLGIWASKRGFITTTAVTLVGVLVAAIVATVAYGGLLYNVISLFLLVVLGGLLLGTRGAVVSTLVAIVIATVSTYLESTGAIVPHPQAPSLTVFTVSAELAVVGVLLYWAGRGQQKILDGLITTTSTLDATEQRYAELVHHLADGLVVTDVEGVIQSVNPAIEAMVGHPASEMVGRHFWQLPFFDDVTLPPIRANFNALLRGEELTRVEVELQTDKGRVVVDAAPRLLHREDGQIELSATVRDITQQVRAVEELKVLERQLQESQRMEALGRLAGGVAHDFNNWLTLIVANAELLRDEFGANEGLDAITEAAYRSTALTQQLLTFARQQPTAPTTVDVAKQLRELVPMLERLVGHQVTLTTELTTDAWVLIDPSQFEQIVMNLVVNASEAVDRGTVELRAGTVSIDDVPHVSIDVIDDGPGVPEATRAHLFEPFFTTKNTGTGLGLATVHGVVTGAGGSIQLLTSDRGAHFNVLLPALDPVVTTKAAPASPGQRVLIVDDDDGVRRTVARVLQTDFDIETTSGGAEALELLSKNRFDVVLSDIVMPEMTGTELLDEIRARFPDVRVVLMSGYAQEAELQRSEEADAFVGKPFTPAALRETMHRVLNNS